MRIPRLIGRTIWLLALFLLFQNHVQAATLFEGKEIVYAYLFPNQATPFFIEAPMLIGPGPERNDLYAGGPETVLDISDTNILIEWPNEHTFNPADFSGILIWDFYNVLPAFSSVTINPVSTLTDFDSSRISFDADRIYINFQGLVGPPGEILSLDVAAVPEPASMAIWGVGLVGLTIGARLRKRWQRA